MNNDDSRYLKEAFGDDKKKKWLKDNPTLTSNQIDTYIKWFDDIRKSRPAAAKTLDIDGVPKGNDRFDISKYNNWHSFESFVDAVRAQTQLKGEKLSDNLKVDAKPLFEKNGLEVYYADTPKACISYKGNIPYSWCVAREDSESNMFYHYRLGDNNPTFYFVKDIEATQKELSSGKMFKGLFSNKWHFFVIQVLKTANINDLTDKNYVVTSAKNDGDIQMSWNDIVKIQPKLNGLQREFLPKPLSDLDFNQLTDDYVSDLLRDSSSKQKTIDTLLNNNVPLTDENVRNLLLYSSNVQKTIDTMLSKNVPLTYSNVENLLIKSLDKQPTIDTLLSKNVPLTDKNVSDLIWDYCTNQQKKRFNDLKVKQLGALKLKQQLSETKFKYRDFYSYLK